MTTTANTPLYTVICDGLHGSPSVQVLRIRHGIATVITPSGIRKNVEARLCRKWQPYQS